MKQLLLSLSAFISAYSFAQFTQTNEPAIGNATQMYVLDSNAVNYATTTGTGVTWDYSTTYGYPGQTKDVSAVDPSATANGSNYTSASKAIEITNFATSYFTSSSSSRNSTGFVFDGGALAGTVQIVFDSDDELLMNYPFNVTDNLTDNMSGTAITGIGSYPCTGTVDASCDGSGTLILNASTTITNVLRYKLKDQVTATVPGLGSVVMDRTQYEYYDFASSNLPVFVHATLTITMGGTPTTQSLVLSSVAPDEYLAVDENAAISFNLYPNPAKGQVTIEGLTGNEVINITDMSGRVVLSTTATAAAQNIAIDMLNSGVYNVVVSSNGLVSVKNLVIK